MIERYENLVIGPELFQSKWLRVPRTAGHLIVSIDVGLDDAEQLIECRLNRRGQVFASSQYPGGARKPKPVLVVDLMRSFRVKGRKLVGIEGERISVLISARKKTTCDLSIEMTAVPVAQIRELRRQIALWR